MKNSNRNIWLRSVIVGASVWTASAAVAGPSPLTCVVDNTIDSSAGLPPIANSLRDCMTRVRSGDTIIFDASVFDLSNSNAATTIHVVDELPPLEYGNVTIEASGRRVTINGSGANSANGLVIRSDANVIRGLSIIGFPKSGVVIDSKAGNTIGGSRALGGGPNGQGLRISANGSFGIEIVGAGASSNTVRGCWIGLDAAGTSPEPNLAGVLIEAGANSNTIGSVIAGEANVISGNAFEGVTLSDAGTDDNVVIGNVIGAGPTIDSAGARQQIGNGSAGVFLSRGTNGSTVGGTNSGEGNTVAFNGGSGIEVRASASRLHSIRGNQISSNSGGGITLFDGSNDGIQPATIIRVQDLGVPGALGTGTTLRIDGTAPSDGNVEIFSDSGDQGATFLARKDVLTGAWTTDVEVSETSNLSATLTDALGNTSRFGVFGLTSLDTDDDGVSDDLEGLADTDPDDSLDTPQVAGTIAVTKLSIKLNFASTGKDSIKMTTRLTLPAGFTADGSTLGVHVAGYFEQFTLDENGKASSGSSKVALSTSIKSGPVVKYGITMASLQAALASSGLQDMIAENEMWLLPIAITLGDSVQFGTVTVTYKATQGKSGKAKQSL